MKTVGSYKRSDTNKRQDKAVEKAVDYFKSLGKKPHPNSQTMIRIYINGRYFQYSATTGKWCYLRSIGVRKWYTSESLDDFMQKAEDFAWCKA